MSETIVTFYPRNDFVVFKFIDKGRLRGIEMPQISAQAKERVVVAMGPKVEDLKIGDKVMVIGKVGEDVIALPNDSSLFLTRQANVTLIVVETEGN